MTDEPKNPRLPDPDPEPVDDLGSIDVPDAPEDFDDLVDAVDATGTDVAEPKTPVRDLYDVTGRARPQRIVPRTPEPEPAVASDPEPEEDARTTVFAVGEDTAFTGDSDDDATRVFDPVSTSTDRPRGGRTFDSGYGEDFETAVLGGAVAEEIDQQDVPTREEYIEAPVDEVERAPRGTLDVGLLLLRIVVGVLLILHGAQTLFAFGGDPGIDALEARLADVTGGDILAVALPVAEVVAGGLLVLGLATPVGGAVAMVSAGFMTLFELSLSGAGYWPYELSQGAQSWGFLALGGLILVFTGPGRYGADISRGWATRPRASAWLWAVIGVVGTAALWILTGGGNPL